MRNMEHIKTQTPQHTENARLENPSGRYSCQQRMVQYLIVFIASLMEMPLQFTTEPLP